MRSLCFLAAMLIAATTIGQQPRATITGPKQAAVGDLVILDASQSVGSKYKWIAVGHKKAFLPVDSGMRLVFASGASGDYIFALVVAGANANGGAEVDIADWTITVGTPGPGPGPVPPGPIDPPAPPQPPTPINAVGLHCLIIEDMQQRDDLPASQREAITATGPGSLRARLAEVCAKDAAGQPCLRFVSTKDDLSRDLPVWREAAARPRQSVPWIVLGNGKTGYEGPLPQSSAEAIALVNRYAEAKP